MASSIRYLGQIFKSKRNNEAASRVKNRAVSSAMPAANTSSFVRTLRNSFRRRKKPDLSTELENDESAATDQNRNPNDVKLTIKSNETTFVKLNVRTGLANYKCKFLGKMEVAGKSGIKHTDLALRSFKTLKERKKQRIIIQVNPEVIRVVSAKDSMLLFDQAVDKISFCAPSNVYPDAFSYIARDGASQRWLCYCFSAKNGITGSTLSQVFGEAFKACLENRQRLQKETGQKPIDVQMEPLDGGGFTRAGKGTFRQPKRKPTPNLIDTSNDVPIIEAEQPEQSNVNEPTTPNSSVNGTSFSSPNARARPAAPSHLVREASLRLPLKKPETEPFKKYTSMRAYNSNTARNDEIPAVKNWSEQLEAIKALNIQVHNSVPVIESSPSTPATPLYPPVTPSAAPAWEPADPFNELAKRPKQNPYGVMRAQPLNVNNNNPFVQLDQEPKTFVMKF